MYIIDEKLERAEILKRYKELIKISHTSDKEEKRLIKKAFVVAMNAHSGVRRKNGEPYIYHPLEVAKIASYDLGLGATAIVCALLHDVVEDTEYTIEDIENIFGTKVAQIVDGLTKIDGVFEKNNNHSIQSENFKKLFTAMGDDMRVILLKLCDRLHNMRTLDFMPKHKQLKIASETRQFYVPLAHRLGLYEVKSELEDLATKHINPNEYFDIESRLKDSEEEREAFIHTFSEPIKQKLIERCYKFTLSGRVKSITSILGKIEKKGVKFEEIYDIFAIRIILDVPIESEKESCFAVYSIISSMYRQRLDRFRDWLTVPKSNGYEALHCTVMSAQGKWVEIQIRSQRMDDIAEKGLAAHYKYKEVKEGDLDNNLDNWLTKVRDILDNDSSTAVDFVNDFQLTVVTDQITVFTPKGALNRKCVGRSAQALLAMVGVNVGPELRCIVFEGPKEHPLIEEELMMPILGMVRVKDFEEGVETAVWLEHGNRHSAHIHSKNVDHITTYAKALDTAILVKNGPSYAALGFGGEGYCTFTIASRTGEGLTAGHSFTKSRRCTMSDSLCIR